MRTLAALIVLSSTLLGQQRVEIALEKREAGAWKTSDPAHVFNTGDQVRFRVKANFSGFLYAISEGTSGETTTLFPTEQAGTENQIEAGKEYVIPGNQGAFKLTGPAGYDTVYWIVSPVRLGQEVTKYKPLPPPPSPNPVPSSLTPRCDDSILRARGECVDSAAGVKKNDVPQMRSRELLFMRKQEKSVVSAPPQSGNSPFTYLFRIAHR
jgi:hypothetical protein